MAQFILAALVFPYLYYMDIDRTQVRFAIALFAALLVLGVLAQWWRIVNPPKPALQPRDKVTIQLFWFHQAQFAPIYVAHEKGFFAAEGIDAVGILPGGPLVEETEVVARGDADFGIASASDVLVARERGLPVKMFGVIFKRNPLVFASLAPSGVLRLEDFVGKKIGIRSVNDVVALKAMLAKKGMSIDDVELVNVGFETQPILEGLVAAESDYLISEVADLKRQGYDLKIFAVDDYEVTIYGDVLFATEAMLTSRPDLAMRFFRAVRAGAEYAVRNPEEAAAITLSFIQDADEVRAIRERSQMEAMIPLIVTGQGRALEIKPGVIAEMQVMLKENDVLTTIVPEEEAVDFSIQQSAQAVDG